MQIDVIVPTYHKKLDIVSRTADHNIKILEANSIDFSYIIVVDFHSNVDSTLNYFNLNSLSDRINIYFRFNQTGHKESFRCINLGFHLGNAPFVLIMDDDYTISNEYIAAIKKLDAPAIFAESFLCEGERVEINLNPFEEAMTIGSGQPKFIKRSIAIENGLYDDRYYGYMYCDNDFSRRYGGLPGILILDGADLGINTESHDHFYGDKSIPMEQLHSMYIEHNRKLFFSV